MAYILSTVLSIALLTCYLGGSEACDTNVVERCVRDIASASNSISSFNNNHAYDELCRKVDNVKTCLARAGCLDEDDMTVKMVWNGIKNGMQYLCGEGKQAMLRNAQCLSLSSTSVIFATVLRDTSQP